MKSSELEQYIFQTYGVKGESLWARFPDYKVFRHKQSQKWFAVFMSVPKEKLGLSGQEKISIINLKCDPGLIGSLLAKEGFYPAYHMNKTNWISISLEENTKDSQLKNLLNLSFELTAAAKRK